MREYLQSLFFLILTFLFSPLFLFISFLRRDGYQRILVIQAAKLGDTVCSTPVFREIKKNYPSTYLIVACLKRVAPVLKNNPHIDQIVFIDDFIYGRFFQKLKFILKIKKEKINCSFTLLPSLLGAITPIWSLIPKKIITTSKYANKSYKILSIFFRDKLEYKRHTLTVAHYLNLLKFIGIYKFNQKKELFFSQKDKEAVDEYFKKDNLSENDFIIGAAVTAGNKLKEWEPKKFAKLFDKLIDNLGAKIVVFGSNQDRDKINYVQSMMKNKIFNTVGLTISQLSAFLAKVKLFVSVDTGPLYMANVLDIPVVDISGPIDIYEQPPLGDKCVIIQKNLKCVPCSFILPPARICRNKDHLACLKLTTVSDVYEGIIRLIKREKIWSV